MLIPLSRPRLPDLHAVSAAREWLPLGLGFAVILVELGVMGGHALASWRSATADHRDGAQALRPTLGLFSSNDGAPISPALRPRDDLTREAEPFILTARSTAEHRRAVQCLANAVYYEAALEPLDGQRAVAQVVLNRVRDVDFPHSICGVVYQGWARQTGCQFSFTCNGALDRTPMSALYARARGVAQAALDGYVMPGIGTATHYHTADIDPWWRPTLVRIAQVGAHVFYGWPGPGEHVLRRYAGGELALPQAVIDGRVPHTAPIDTSVKTLKVTDATRSGDRKSGAGRVHIIGLTSGGTAQDQPSPPLPTSKSAS